MQSSSFDKDTAFIEGAEETYHHGKFLVINKTFRPPDLCLVSGVPILPLYPTEELELKHVPLYFTPLVAIFTVIPLFAKLAPSLKLEKTIRLHLKFSEKVLRKVVVRAKIGAIGVLIAATLIVTAFILDHSQSLYTTGFTLLASSVGFMILPVHNLRINKVRRGYFYLAGVHKNVLKLYPPFPKEKLPPHPLAR